MPSTPLPMNKSCGGVAATAAEVFAAGGRMPASFLCPINGGVFTDPVIAADGYTYERAAITRWLVFNGLSPFTRDNLDVNSLQPNRALKNAIDEWEAAVAAQVRETGGVPRVRFQDIEIAEDGGREAAEGSYKRVVRGRLVSDGRSIAVGRCRNGESLEVEAEVMHRLGRHPHIVPFLGVAVDESGTEHLVTEWAAYGSLDSVLGRLGDEVPRLQPLVQLTLAQHVCEGMQALVCSGVVHRDLASRNVLVYRRLSTSDPSTVDVKVRNHCCRQSTYVVDGSLQTPMKYRLVSQDDAFAGILTRYFYGYENNN